MSVMPSTAELTAGPSDAATSLAALRTAAAVRERSALIYDWVAAGRSEHFRLHEDRLPAVAAYVASVCRAEYPDDAIPMHSRWRHFMVAGQDRWAGLAAEIPDRRERARAALDLATVSVLLDAGAGPAWRYADKASGQVLSRSEGLAIASLDMFRAGAFSSDPAQPWCADAVALSRVNAGLLGRYFQVSDRNPLVGLEQRARLLRGLGAALAAKPRLFGVAPARPGGMLDASIVQGNAVSAANVLTALLEAYADIWPSALAVNGVALGDAGIHPALGQLPLAPGVAPFHKLSQWLTYSLAEPFQSAGIVVTELDALTGLPEYRNGGLFIDLGVLQLRRDADMSLRHRLDSPLVVEWRAMTVALLDRLLPLVRKELGLGDAFLLPQMLQGGTWTAGRKIARELRPPEGPSPLLLDADGTVF